ncbi:MAG: hypothetical protein ACYTDX_06755, partial [Planctomycetota bacterium]
MLFGAEVLSLAPGLAQALREHDGRIVFVDSGDGEAWRRHSGFIRLRADAIVDSVSGPSSEQERRACAERIADATFPVVPLYGLCYRFEDVYRRCVDGLLETPGPELRVHVAQNGFPGDDRLTESALSDVRDGRIAGHVRYEDNLYGTALEHMYREVFPPDSDCEFVVMTDLDIEVAAEQRDWLSESVTRLRSHPELLLVTVDFDLSNWNR